MDLILDCIRNIQLKCYEYVQQMAEHTGFQNKFLTNTSREEGGHADPEKAVEEAWLWTLENIETKCSNVIKILQIGLFSLVCMTGLFTNSTTLPRRSKINCKMMTS